MRYHSVNNNSATHRIYFHTCYFLRLKSNDSKGFGSVNDRNTTKHGLAQLIDSGGELASCPRTKIHPTRNQEPEYAGVWRRTQGGRGGGTGDMKGPATGEPLRVLQGPGSSLRAAKEGGGCSHGKRRQTHTFGTGRIDKRQRLAGGGWGRHPGGWGFVPVKNVGSLCKQR